MHIGIEVKANKQQKWQRKMYERTRKKKTQKLNNVHITLVFCWFSCYCYCHPLFVELFLLYFFLFLMFYSLVLVRSHSVNNEHMRDFSSFFFYLKFHASGQLKWKPINWLNFVVTQLFIPDHLNYLNFCFLLLLVVSVL